MQVLIQGKEKRVSDRLGAALIKMGKAKPVVESHPKPEPVSKDAGYKTRHIEPQSDDEKDDKPVKKKRGRPRKYKRRDMKPED